MNTRAVFHLISYMLMVIGLAMAACWLVALLHHDPARTQWSLGGTALGVLLASAALGLLTRGEIDLSRRDGFGIVAFGWLLVSLAGSLPFIFSGVIPDPVAAIFETMSGFTTTGASVLVVIDGLPKGILLWRSLTHFIGGMGVLVLCVAILPFLGVGGMQLYRAEMPGPSKDRLAPRVTSTAKVLWGVYLLFCVVEAVLLKFGGMSWFDAWCHAFGTVATGGFSTHTNSIAYFDSLYIEVVITVFAFLASVNFALHYRALRGEVGAFWRDAELRFFCAVWLGACLLMAVNTWGPVYKSLGAALRNSFFTGTSIISTTGFTTVDYDAWPRFSKSLLFFLMLIGGCAGSTGGGIKAVRVFVAIKCAIRETRLFMQPQAIVTVKLGKKPVPNEIVSNILTFILIYLLLFVFATALMVRHTPDMRTALSSVVATLGNVGPGFGVVGPMYNYSSIPDAGQAILTLCMLLGRLELYTVLVLFFPSFWRK